ncbi:S-adenosyl-L-methionine-dependent methyltransferase [Aspergillus sclerotioniger CBS 115572]|uniref:S-adenosyl-L-methionine-dependent methyltransferase n=1 Tax=Aspergillus sclerotioniger CBS 115572 TaxID=1450535 RepID=A0A317XBN3_9EURO|nr:S-adenosyl-L-methionine-dependent methyltransferase [Aspergillus sclerotioniger CBS 115572]PWY96044.1 S-adenosyl-L-methionine-dependent methyltransferase [Aspergillus sclerotioniger CBS 115572]
MNADSIQEIWTEVQSSLEAFQTTGTESTRIDALEKANKLARALEKPRDAILKLAYTPTALMAVKVAHDMQVFPVLAKATSPVPVSELAALKPADPLLVERMMRLCVAFGFAEEPTPCEYLPTAVTKEMVNRTSIGVVESLFLEFLPSVQKTPEYLQATNYRNPEDPLFAPLQYTNNMKEDGFSWLCENPDALARFNNFMEGQRADRPHWADWFPVQDRVLANADTTNPDRALIVDIGGGRGHDLLGFKKRFPDAPGKLVLEDLPLVIDEVQGAQDLDAANIVPVKYNFFTEQQPVKGARVYYFKNVMHDWSDDKARIILKHIVDAMEPGYSKLIMEEYIVPDRNASAIHGMTDVAVMVFCSGLERTTQQWTKLLDSVGLRVNKFWTRAGDGLGVVEAELATS